MKAISIVIAIIINFFLLSCSKKCGSFSREYVCVTISNQSGYKIEKLIVRNQYSDELLTGIENASQKSLLIRNPGEGSYSITAVFENGLRVTRKETYVEGGYSVTEVVTQEVIKTEHSTYQ